MRKEDTVRLNTHAVVRRVEVLRLKQWWLAEAVGVSPRTVNRWLGGVVTRVARENAERLAQHLGCAVEEIVVSDEADVYATRQQQRTAAALIEERDLLGLLSPSDNWHLAEGLIKATMQPNLPLRQLGMLYNLLSIAAWRQGQYEEARGHAERARECGQKCGDRGIVHKAIFNVATIESIAGSSLRALAGYEETLQHPEYFDTRRDHGSALANVAAVYRDFVRFQESLAAQQAAIRIFEELRAPFNLAIAWISMGQVAVELGWLEEAERAYDTAMHYAEASGYERGHASLLLYRADVVSLRGNHDEAMRLAEAGGTGLERFAVYDLACDEIGVRVARRAGDHAEAVRRCEAAAVRSCTFPVMHARLLQEQSRLAHAMGDVVTGRSALREAGAIFRRLGMHARIARGALAEYGAVFVAEARDLHGHRAAFAASIRPAGAGPRPGRHRRKDS